MFLIAYLSNAMGTILIPAKVLKKLTAIARNFFWGGNHEKRSMAYVAWDKITTPIGRGGGSRGEEA